MWSTPKDRKEHNLKFNLTDSALYVQQRIEINRYRTLLQAVEGGLVALEDILAFPINWNEMVMRHMKLHRVLQMSHPGSAGPIARHSSLCLDVDEFSIPSSSRINGSPEISRESRSPKQKERFFKASFKIESVGEIENEEEDPWLSITEQDRMNHSARSPIMQDCDKKFFSSSSYAIPSLVSSSSPSTPVLPTPTSSFRGFSSGPEMFRSLPISVDFTKEAIPMSLISGGNNAAASIQSQAKRRKVTESLRLYPTFQRKVQLQGGPYRFPQDTY